MIDLHCHLLPGIDDGPGTMEQAVELAEIAVHSGTTHAVVTPHIHPGRWENDRDSILQLFNKLRETLAAAGIELKLGYAAEVRLNEQVMQQVESASIPYYGELDGYHIMLLEFPHGQIVHGSEKLVSWLLDRKIRPMIAHPERNRQVMRTPDALTPFLEAQCLIQLTAGSITGHFGEKAQALAQQLLDRDQVTVVASDGHNKQHRPPVLSDAYATVAERYGKERAEACFVDRPLSIVRAQFDGAAT